MSRPRLCRRRSQLPLVISLFTRGILLERRIWINWKPTCGTWRWLFESLWVWVMPVLLCGGVISRMAISISTLLIQPKIGLADLSIAFKKEMRHPELQFGCLMFTMPVVIFLPAEEHLPGSSAGRFPDRIAENPSRDKGDRAPGRRL